MIVAKRKLTPIGLDLADNYVRAVQFVRREGRVYVQAVAERALGVPGQPPSDELVCAALGDLLKCEPFVGREVVSVLGAEDVDIRAVSLPENIQPDSTPRFRRALLNEARSILLYPPEAAVVNYLPLGGDDQAHNGAQVLLVAARKEHVNRHLSLMQAAGLRCAHLDVRPCASLRALPPEPEPVAAVELRNSCTVVALGAARCLQFSRVFRIGWHHFTETLADAFACEPAEAARMLEQYGFSLERGGKLDLNAAEETGVLDPPAIRQAINEICAHNLQSFLRELRRTLDYYSLHRHGQNIGRIWLHGDMLPQGFDAFLAASLNKPATIGDPFSIHTMKDSSGAAHRSAYLVAAGLALRDFLP